MKESVFIMVYRYDSESHLNCQIHASEPYSTHCILEKPMAGQVPYFYRYVLCTHDENNKHIGLLNKLLNTM